MSFLCVIVGQEDYESSGEPEYYNMESMIYFCFLHSLTLLKVLETQFKNP